MQLITVGHGRLEIPEFGALLTGAGVTELVDVRRFPGSRANPAVARDVLPQWLPDFGIAYRWEERLGGRRHLNATQLAESPDTWWRVKDFKAYAAWTRHEEFGAALADVLAIARDHPTVVMCSESVWWRCHRRLVADVATLLHGVNVRHLMPNGALHDHPVAPGARVHGSQVLWDGQATD